MNSVSVFSDSFLAMNTRCSVVFPGVEQSWGEQLFQLLKREVVSWEQKLSRFLPESPVSQLNRAPKNEWLTVDDSVWEVLRACYDFYRASNGAFDITTGPLIQLWKKPQNPGTDELVAAKKRSGFDKVEFDIQNKKMRLLAEGVEFDLGAIGKGIALDTIKPLLKSQGLKSGIISFGESSVLSLGKHPEGKPWPLGLPHVFIPGKYVHVFSLCDGESISTSGTVAINDRGMWQERKHTIDPRTGLPVEGRRTVAVKSTSAALSEFVSTAFLVTPDSERHLLLHKLKAVDIVEVVYSNEGYEYKKRLFNGIHDS